MPDEELDHFFEWTKEMKRAGYHWGWTGALTGGDE